MPYLEDDEIYLIVETVNGGTYVVSVAATRALADKIVEWYRNTTRHSREYDIVSYSIVSDADWWDRTANSLPNGENAEANAPFQRLERRIIY